MLSIPQYDKFVRFTLFSLKFWLVQTWKTCVPRSFLLSLWRTQVYFVHILLSQACIKFLTEFPFLIRYYNLLYQSLIPNCYLTLNTVQRYYNISQSGLKLILTAPTVKVRVQRLLNFLLKTLNADKDHVKFCNVISSITVIDDLPHKLTKGTHIDVITVKWLGKVREF